MAKRLALIALLVSFLLPIVAFAQITECTLGRNITYRDVTWQKGWTICDPDVGCSTGAPNPTTTEDWGTICLINSIYNVTDWISFILIAVAAIMIIMGAFTLATAAGAPEKVTAGRNYIIFALVGLIVAMLSRAIPAIAKRFAG